MGSAENRSAFVNTVTSFAEEYDLDGLDFEFGDLTPNSVLR